MNILLYTPIFTANTLFYAQAGTVVRYAHVQLGACAAVALRCWRGTPLNNGHFQYPKGVNYSKFHCASFNIDMLRMCVHSTLHCNQKVISVILSLQDSRSDKYYFVHAHFYCEHLLMRAARRAR